MLKFISALLLIMLLVGCDFPLQKSALQQADPLSLPAEVAGQTAENSAAGQAVAQDKPTQEAESSLVKAVIRPLPEPVAEFLNEAPPLPYYGDFPIEDHERVERLLDYYTGSGRKMFGSWLERAGRYIPKIQMIFASEGLPLDLAYLAMIESGFNDKAYSWANAAGPWQFIESTGRLYGLKNNWWQDERCDIEKSTRAAAAHLKYLYRRFDGNWYLAVAAYNAGGGKVHKAVKERKSDDFWDLTEGKVLREETRNYLPKLLATLKIVKNLKEYGFGDLDFYEPLEYETVTVPTSTDLEIISKFCDADYDEIKALNPELKRWSTPPGEKNYQLRVPWGTAEQFNQSYAKLPADQRARYHRHQIKSGDTLRALARKYRIQVDDIISLNNIRNPRALKVGSDLILPLKEGFTRLPIDELADSYVRSRRRTYKVREGDSLWKIANKFGVSQQQLRVWNRLGWSNLIRPGQVLAVSRPGAKLVAKTRHSHGPSRKLIYKVQPGDTLWGISRQFDVETDQIRSWNDLSRSHILQPGQKLTLMVPVARQG